MNNGNKKKLLSENEIVTKAANRARRWFWIKVIVFTVLVIVFLAWRWWSR